jgi:mycothiol synthase
VGEGLVSLRSAEQDLEAYVATWNQIAPDEPASTEEQRSRLERDPRRLHLLAEEGGRIVGCGFAGPSDSPGRGYVEPRVLPGERRRGIGTLLLRELLGHAAGLGFTTASSHVDGHDAGSLAFARRHGFEEVDRQVEQVKVVGNEHPGASPDGVAFVTVAERPELLRATHDLAVEGYADMAVSMPVTISLDDWLAEEATVPEGSFVALAEGEIVGYTGLCRDGAGVVEDGLTVVRRDWRRRGLAEALKRSKLAWAARNGIDEIVTWTQTGNEAMRALNERLGYEYRSVSITVRAPLDEIRL